MEIKLEVAFLKLLFLVLQPQDEFLPYLSETSDRIESAVLMSDYPIFKSQEIIITLYGNHFYPEVRVCFSHCILR